MDKSVKKRIVTLLGLSKEAFGAYRIQIVILVILGFLSGILEGIGVNAIIPLFSFVMGSGEGGSDFISKAIEQLFGILGITFSLKFLLVFIVTLFILKAIVLFIFNYIRISIVAKYEEAARQQLFLSTLQADWGHLLKEKLGHLETVIMTDVRMGAVVLERISTTIIMGTSLIVYAIVALNISFHVTLFTLGLGSVLFLLFKPILFHTRMAGRKVAKFNKDVAHHVNENIVGMKTVKVTHVQEHVANVGTDLFARLRSLRIKIGVLQSVTASLLQPISLIFISMVFAFSYKTPGFNFAVLIAVIYLIQRIFQYIQQIQSSLTRIHESLPFLKNVLDYQRNALKQQEKDEGVRPFDFQRELSCEHVYFHYGKEQPILIDVSFSIQKGKMVGLIGPSGSGKTTIVDLLLRLFTPTEGKILLDGNDAQSIDIRSWRKNIGYVSQDIFLTNKTVKNNIKFYDNSITNEAVIVAAKKAHIHDFIQSLPQGYDTVVGERGIRLSAGQRQRIVIARALVQNPKILILDEATSALDNESELQIQKIIEQLKENVAVLAVAHRLTTVMNSDTIVVLEDGRIVEEGNPKELLKDTDSRFYKTYNINEK